MSDDLTVGQLRAIGSGLAKNRVEPNQDGEYILFMRPDVVQELRHQTARQLYKQKSHNERYKRRYGHYPVMHEAEIGEMERFLFISRSKT